MQTSVVLCNGIAVSLLYCSTKVPILILIVTVIIIANPSTAPKSIGENSLALQFVPVSAHPGFDSAAPRSFANSGTMFELLIAGVNEGGMPHPPPEGKCFVMAFPVKYGLPPMCVVGETPDSPAHVKAVFSHMQKVAKERKMFQFEANGASALAARWRSRVGE